VAGESIHLFQGEVNRLDLSTGIVDGATSAELVRHSPHGFEGVADGQEERGHRGPPGRSVVVIDSIDDRRCEAATAG
jgi:hypothetical protein